MRRQVHMKEVWGERRGSNPPSGVDEESFMLLKRKKWLGH